MVQLSFERMLRAIDIAVSAEFERNGGIDHRAVLITPDRLINHSLDWEDDDSKQRAFAELSARLNAEKPERYAIVGEAWKAPWPEHPTLLQASKSDQRVEILYILLVDQSGRNGLATRPIERPHWQRDPKPRLGPVTLDLNMEGAFANLFDKQGGING